MILSYGWQQKIPLPKSNYPELVDGLRKTNLDRDAKEFWFSIKEVNETKYQTSSIDINVNLPAKFAVYVSLFISVLLGFEFVIGIVYGVNYVYLAI